MVAFLYSGFESSFLTAVSIVSCEKQVLLNKTAVKIMKILNFIFLILKT